MHLQSPCVDGGARRRASTREPLSSSLEHPDARDDGPRTRRPSAPPCAAAVSSRAAGVAASRRRLAAAAESPASPAAAIARVCAPAPAARRTSRRLFDCTSADRRGRAPCGALARRSRRSVRRIARIVRPRGSGRSRRGRCAPCDSSCAVAAGARPNRVHARSTPRRISPGMSDRRAGGVRYPRRCARSERRDGTSAVTRARYALARYSTTGSGDPPAAVPEAAGDVVLGRLHATAS